MRTLSAALLLTTCLAALPATADQPSRPHPKCGAGNFGVVYPSPCSQKEMQEAQYQPQPERESYEEYTPAPEEANLVQDNRAVAVKRNPNKIFWGLRGIMVGDTVHSEDPFQGSGFFVRQDSNARWGAELAIDSFQDTNDTPHLPMLASVLHYLPSRSNFRVYGLAGVGMSFRREPQQILGAPALQTGLGAELKLAPKLRINTDIRWLGELAEQDNAQPAANAPVENPFASETVFVTVGISFAGRR